MKLSTPSVFAIIVLALALLYYKIEPWAVTFVDDGPYYSTRFSGSIDDSPIHSQVELRRFGQLVYKFESRTLPDGSGSVLVLRNSKGRVSWARLPVKPDGELGILEVRRAYMTWYGGWRVAISPEYQEGGNLYLSAFGQFRFFNHSW